MSYVGHGKAISTRRSAAGNAPSAPVWANSGYLDFVADCGADPTGAVSCAAAFDQAFVLLSALASNPALAQTTVRLFIPPGQYTLSSALGTPVWNFNGLTTSVTIDGINGASIIAFEGFDGPLVANAYNIFIRDLTFIGLETDAFTTPDAATCLQLNAVESGVIERCKFESILVTNAIVEVQGGYWVMRDCNFGACACYRAPQACVWANQCASFVLDHCYFVDTSKVNAFAPAYSKVAANSVWVRVDGMAGITPQQPLVEITNCLFDEGAKYHVIVQGATVPVPFVRMIGNYHNPPIHDGVSFFPAGVPACVQIQKVSDFTCEGMIDSGFTVSSIASVMNLIAVDHSRIVHVNVNNASSSNVLNADPDCGYVRIEHSPELLTQNTFSYAKLTEIVNSPYFGSAAANGGTFTVSFPILTNLGAHLEADVHLLTSTIAGARPSIARLFAECDVENVSSAAVFATQIAGSLNPKNSASFLAARSESADVDLLSGGGAAPTAVWTVGAGGATLTVTNAGTIDANVTAKISVSLEGISGPAFDSLTAWYRGDTGITLNVGNVSAWADQITGGANNVIQATPAGQPGYNANGGLGYVSSALTTSLQAAGFPTINQPYEIFVVCHPTSANNPASGYLIDSNVGNQSNLQQQAGTGLALIYSGAAGITGTQLTVADHIVDGQFIVTGDGGVAVDGGALSLGNPGGNAITGGLTIGNDPGNPALGFVGRIYEVLIYSKILTASERSLTNAYLKARYSIP